MGAMNKTTRSVKEAITLAAETFCVIRSYLATMHKQGANLFESLVHPFQDTPPQPRFACGAE